MREPIIFKIDQFVHPKTNRTSLCYRINYRSMDRQVKCVLCSKSYLIFLPRSLSNAEVNHVQDQVVSRLKNQFDVEIR
jgi:phenylalanyl-tRNA synthetase alpha chain